jgi:sugar/nucleoside kinase (ribokinase family)
VPEELDNILEIVSSFAIFSPNLLEMQSILSITPSKSPTPSEVEQAAKGFLRITKSSVDVVLRAGELGSYTLSRDGRAWWVPAYWADEQGRVKDPTGGGNAFLGGLCAGLLISNGDLRIGRFRPSVRLMQNSFDVRIDSRVICDRTAGSTPLNNGYIWQGAVEW